MPDEAQQMMEDEMAKAMEAMAAGDGGDGELDMAAAMAEMEGGTLSQDEIDSLLGFSSGNASHAKGIMALLERSQENYERLPMLEVVFDRYVRSLSTSLRNFTGENVDITIDSITSMRFEDYLNSVPLPALMAIFQAVEWENFGLITIDSGLTYSLVDILLGGGRVSRPVRVEGRPFTTIEQDIIRSVTKMKLDEMSAAFNPLTPATFRLDRLETNPRFATIARPASAVTVISTRVEMEQRGGKADIMLPYATLEPIKDLLTQMFSGESFGSEVSWESFLSSEVRSTVVTLEARLSPRVITLKELGLLRVGTTVVMNEAPNENFDVVCKGIKMFSGKLGASGKNLAISVTDKVSKDIQRIL
jgi:flagellar motor switch protein FliM